MNEPGPSIVFAPIQVDLPAVQTEAGIDDPKVDCCEHSLHLTIGEEHFFSEA